MYGVEEAAVTWPQFVVFAVLIISLLAVCIWVLWRWDVRHEHDYRLPKSLDPRIREFVTAVDAGDFDAAETAVTRAFWSNLPGDAPSNP